MKKYLGLLLIGSVLSSCSSHKVQTIEYYEQHYDEAAAAVKQCKSLDLSDSNVKQDCENAAKALQIRAIKGGNTTPAKYGTHNVNADY